MHLRPAGDRSSRWGLRSGAWLDRSPAGRSSIQPARAPFALMPKGHSGRLDAPPTGRRPIQPLGPSLRCRSRCRPEGLAAGHARWSGPAGRLVEWPLKRSSDRPKECELNSSARSYTFKVCEEDESDHFLALDMVCLSEGAKDECNVVEVVGRDYQNKEITVPVANLKLSCQPSLCLEHFEFQPPVTFHLRSGSGPVHLAGQHQIFHRRDFSESSGEDEEDIDEEGPSTEEEEDFSPIKPAKKQRRS